MCNIGGRSWSCKTIETGIVIAQKWAEDKRKILIIVPASVRKQGQVELVEKFYLPSVILEGKSTINYNEVILIMSYQFASENANKIKLTQWDLVTIDEVHRLRNVYKPHNVIQRISKMLLLEVLNFF